MVHLWKVVWLLSLGLNSAPSLAGLLQCFGSECLGGIQQHLVLTLLKAVGALSQRPHRPGPAVSLGTPVTVCFPTQSPLGDLGMGVAIWSHPTLSGVEERCPHPPRALAAWLCQRLVPGKTSRGAAQRCSLSRGRRRGGGRPLLGLATPSKGNSGRFLGAQPHPKQLSKVFQRWSLDKLVSCS